MSKWIIFQELCVIGINIIQLIPFVCEFYTFESPLFYNHHNRERDVIIIPSTMGIRQGDPFEPTLFILTHFRALCSIANHFFSCLFLFIANDIHIINPLIVSFT